MPDDMDLEAGTDPIRVVLPSNFLAVRQALQHVRSSLSKGGTGDDALGTIEIVLAEVLNNLVEHAYAEGPGVIEIRASYLPDAIAFRISDRGAPMPGEQLPTGVPPANSADGSALPEGGFGWQIIHDLTADLSYDRDGDRNILTFTIGLADATPA